MGDGQMKRTILLLAVSAAVLASCSKSPNPPARERPASMDLAEPPPAQFGIAPSSPRAPSADMPAASVPVDVESGSSGTGMDVPHADIPVSLPKIAYVYSLGFRIAGPKIPALEQRHADLCEAKGPQTCRIISMNQSGSEGDYSSGTLQLAVASSQARTFAKELATLAEGDDGKQVLSAISGEDLSKQIVDTDARLRAHTLLRDRLMDVLATRRGTVTELVEAERGVAQVDEEIDEARSWLAEMKGRVAFSRVDINYAAGAPASGSFGEPIHAAVGSLGAIFGNLLALVIVLAAIGVPAAAVVVGSIRLWRRFGATGALAAEPLEA
jgi:hypothetical protein